MLALLGGCLLPVCRTRVYTNHWAVKISGGFSEADRIASKYGFINIGQVRTTGWPGLPRGLPVPRAAGPSPSSRCAPQLLS